MQTASLSVLVVLIAATVSAQSTQPADGGKQWALDVTDCQLVSAMPERVESIWVERPSASSSSDPKSANWMPPAVEGFTEIRTVATALGGSDFRGMHMSCGNFNGRTITVTLDSLAPVRQLFEAGYAHGDAAIESMSHSGELLYVKRYVAMRSRVGRPELVKTDYCAFLNDYCLVTAESPDETVAILGRLRDPDQQNAGAICSRRTT